MNDEEGKRQEAEGESRPEPLRNGDLRGPGVPVEQPAPDPQQQPEPQPGPDRTKLKEPKTQPRLPESLGMNRDFAQAAFDALQPDGAARLDFALNLAWLGQHGGAFMPEDVLTAQKRTEHWDALTDQQRAYWLTLADGALWLACLHFSRLRPKQEEQRRIITPDDLRGGA